MKIQMFMYAYELEIFRPLEMKKKGLFVFSPDFDFNWQHLYNYHESDFCNNNCLLNFTSWLPELESRDSETKKTYEFNLSRCELIFTRTNWQIWKKKANFVRVRELFFLFYIDSPLAAEKTDGPWERECS